MGWARARRRRRTKRKRRRREGGQFPNAVNEEDSERDRAAEQTRQGSLVR